eukprot:267960_1
MGRITLLSCITLWMVAKAADFKLGIQGAHKQNEAAVGCVDLDVGYERYSDLFSIGGSASLWATDTGTHDPDCWRVTIKPGSISVTDQIEDKDIRFCIAVIDHLEHPTSQSGDQTSPTVCTAWASEGGGWAEWVADFNCYDFDGLRVSFEERDLSGLRIIDAQVGIQLGDGIAYQCGDPSAEQGEEAFSPWLSGGGGFSDWTGDLDTRNPDAVRMYGAFDARCSIVGLYAFDSVPHSCQCIPGSVCHDHNSHCNKATYIANILDVVVDEDDMCPDGSVCCCSCANCDETVSIDVE